MVLLKQYCPCIGLLVAIIFTFQYGATKTNAILNVLPLNSKFTFQYGATKTQFDALTSFAYN